MSGAERAKLSRRAVRLIVEARRNEEWVGRVDAMLRRVQR